MAMTTKLPEKHEPLVGRAEDFRWYWLTEWSCPLHDRDENEWEDEELEITCNSCLVAGWKKVYDADGWAFLIFEERDAMSKILEAYYMPVVKEMLNSEIILGEHLEVHKQAAKELEWQ